MLFSHLRPMLFGAAAACLLVMGLHLAARGEAVRAEIRTSTSALQPADLYRGGLEELPPNTRYEFYPVSGRTNNEVWEEIFNVSKGKGLLCSDGKRRFAGWNTYVYTWNGDYARKNGMVRWNNASVKVSNAVSIPVWAPPAGADARTVAKWMAFIKTLSSHECGHARIHNELAPEFEREMAALAASSRAELDRITSRAFSAFLERAGRHDEEYDAETRHGAAQGAMFVRMAE